MQQSLNTDSTEQNEYTQSFREQESSTQKNITQIFIIILLLLLPIVGFIGYQWGLSAATQSITDQEEVVTEAVSSPNPVIENDTEQPAMETHLTDDLFENSQIVRSSLPPEKVNQLLETLQTLNPGLATGSDNPEIEMVVFADLTEESFSGKFLTQRAPVIQEKYGDRVRLWYIHSVLPYRDNPNWNSSIDTTQCLANQGSIWPFMTNLVENKGQHTYNYNVPDRLAFRSCITESFSDEKNQTDVKELGSQMMETYGISGIPTSILIVPEENYAVSIISARQDEDFQQVIDLLLSK